MSVMKYFKKIDKSLIFIGNTLEVKIPLRYEEINLMDSLNDKVEALAVFEMIVNGSESYKLLLLNMITMIPSNKFNRTIDGIPYLVLMFEKGDTFIESTELARKENIAYLVFLEFIYHGRMPKFLDYDDYAKLFDKTQEVCNMSIRTPHSVLEMIYSHLSRSNKDLNTKYRYTDLKELPVFLGTKNVSYALVSTMSKLAGAYINDGINSALVNPSDTTNKLEDILRS